jgi:hypothetical protein
METIEEKTLVRSTYNGMTPEERRGRFFLKPAFREAYNELVEADRFFPVPHYVWEKWTPVIGLLAVGVYLELKRVCFTNRATGERRVKCWPKQETIARRLGVKKRQTIAAALRVLEERGFITRARTTYNDKGSGRIRRGVTEYWVWHEPPLVDEDAIELLARHTTPLPTDFRAELAVSTAPGTTATDEGRGVAQDRRYARGTFGCMPVDNCAEGPKSGHSHTSEKRTCELDTRTKNTLNVPNVVEGSREDTEPRRQRPEGISPHAESVATVVSDTIATMEGDRTGARHRNFRLYLKLAYRIPESLLQEAIRATRDAYDGRKVVGEGVSMYFYGTVRRIALAHGIDIGTRQASRPPDSTRTSLPRPHELVEEPAESPAAVRRMVAKSLQG